MCLSDRFRRVSRIPFDAPPVPLLFNTTLSAVSIPKVIDQFIERQKSKKKRTQTALSASKEATLVPEYG
jgi:hypothetical protein